MRKFTAVFLAALLAVSVIAGALFAGCAGTQDAEDYTPYVKQSGSSCEIGHENRQKWVFSKEGANWIFEGVDVKIGKNWQRVIDHRNTEMNGGLFNAFNVPIGSEIQEITAEQEDGSSTLVARGNGFVAAFYADSSPFIKRELQFTFSEKTTLFEDKIRVSLLTEPNKYEESGYIATRAAADSKLYLPYAFPAIFSTLSAEDYSVSMVDVVDWYETHDAFKTASRQANARGSLEIGLSTAIGTIEAGETATVCEYFKFEDASAVNFYEEIGAAQEKSLAVNPLLANEMSALDNRAVESWDAIAEGLVRDITDPRARNEKLLNALADYGYSDGSQWGSSFSTMNVTNGFIRYALSTGDEELINIATDYALGMVEEVRGKNWIEPTSFAPEGYFHYAAQDYSFTNDVDGGEEGATALSTWKYYDRVYKLGEIAKITGNEQLVEGFLKCLPFVQALKTEDGYKQPVSFDLYTREPLTGYEGGGSAGATAMWAFIHFLAYDLTGNSEYLNEAVGAIDYASQLGFEDMRLMRNYPKPLAIAWVIRTCVKAYEETGDYKFIERAETVLDGLYFFFYNNTNPYTTFATTGWGYACSRERWENTLEMYGAIKFIAPLLQYSDDVKLLELYAAAGYTYSWTMPVNGYPEGNPASRWDGLDGVYIGFEFPTGAQGDNPEYDGGAQSALRQVKALYGAGEAFQLQQMYAAYGESLDRELTMVCYSAVSDNYSVTDNRFILYNPTAENKEDTVVRFNFRSGTYEVSVDGTAVGNFSSETLGYGIKLSVGAGESVNISVRRTGDSGAQTASAPESFEAKIAENNVSYVRFATESLPATDYYIVESSNSEDFTDCRRAVILADRMGSFKDYRTENQRTYYRIEAVQNGALVARSGIVAADPVPLTGLVQEDFSSATGWTVENCIFKSDGFIGYMVPQGIDEGVSASTKTFTVDLSSAPVFEIFPVSKNIRSVWKVVLTVDGQEMEAVPASSLIEQKSYRFDLSDIADGTKEVTVRLEVSGRNRGFAVEKIRFVNQTSETGQETSIEKSAGTGTYSGKILTMENSVGIQDGELKATFNPEEFSTLFLRYDNARILDNIRVRAVWNGGEEVLTGRLTENKELSLDLSAVFSGVNQNIDVSFIVENENKNAVLTSARLEEDGVAEKFAVNSSTFALVNAEWGAEGVISSAGGYARRDVWINTNETRELTLNIASVGPQSNWSLRFHNENTGDGAQEIVLAESNRAGEFSVNLEEALGGAGIYSGSLRLYVNGEVSFNWYGMHRMQYLLAEDNYKTSDTVLRFSGTDLSIYKYLSFEVSALSPDAEWRVYVKTTSGLTELRADTERAYPVKYFRGKRGFFKYEIPAEAANGDVLEIVVVLFGNDAELKMEGFGLSSSNAYPVDTQIEVIA